MPRWLTQDDGRCAIDLDLAFPVDRIVAWDWTGVDLRKESRPSADPSLVNVQARVEEVLNRTSSARFMFNDDGSGELADVVVIEDDATAVLVTLYHCKYSAEATAGARVEDLYEVCGQGLKSARRRRKQEVLEHLRHRFDGGRALRGDLTTLDDLERLPLTWKFRVVLVQPGVCKGRLSDPMTEIVGATDTYLQGQGFDPMLLVCSA